MKVGVVGLGYWGPNLVRNFSGNSEVEKVIACDKSLGRLKFIKERFPNVDTTDDLNVLLASDIAAVAIATPVNTHFPIAKACIEAGKHIWVEKPFTATSNEAQELINLAEQKNVKIFVDHTFIYTGAVKKMKELIENDELGQILYFDSVRINLGLFQHDVNVIWDLAPHDLSIMHYLIPKNKVVGVTANGIANYYDHENVAHLAVYFENNCFAHFHTNWTSPVKIRRMLVGGKKKMLVFDDMENLEKIKVYDAGIKMETSEKIHEALVQYRMGDMFSPKVLQTEALSLGVKEFIDAIYNNRQPLTNGYDGLEVVKILEAADKSIKNKGQFIEI